MEKQKERSHRKMDKIFDFIKWAIPQVQKFAELLAIIIKGASANQRKRGR
jgi:hypothetical protein